MAFDINIRDCKHTPSFITAGLEGDVGKEGQRGTSLYFSNYDLTNDYYKDIVIRKLTNNVMLSSDADIKQEGREYINGDLILCTDKKIYEIKKENGVYDIECIGILQDENITNDFKDNIINVTIKVSFDELSIGTPPSSVKQKSFTTRKTACLTLQPRIYTLVKSKDDENEDDNNIYEYFLRIHLYNKKYMHDGEYSLKRGLSYEPEDSLSDGPKEPFGLSLTNKYIEFYKKMEFRLCNVTEEQPYDERYNIVIPDMAMDLLHPSGNNICFNYDNSPKDEDFLFQIDDDYKCIKYDDASIPKYDNLNNLNNNELSCYVQFEKNTIGDKVYYNRRSGESCYFSGMSKDDGRYNLNDDEKCSMSYDERCEQMFSFLTSEKNKIEIVCVNTETRRVEIIDTKNSNIKCKFILSNDKSV